MLTLTHFTFNSILDNKDSYFLFCVHVVLKIGPRLFLISVTFLQLFTLLPRPLCVHFNTKQMKRSTYIRTELKQNDLKKIGKGKSKSQLLYIKVNLFDPFLKYFK